MGNPCLRCGACCAHFRVSFYWSEADTRMGGSVPPELTEQLTPTHSAMRGTLHAPVRCQALAGSVGDSTCCRIYAQRPSPCRELEPWDEHGQPDEKCARARAAHKLPALPPRHAQRSGNPPAPQASHSPLVHAD